MARSAGGWRMLPVHFGPWQTIYWWFRRFVRRLLFRTIHGVALMLDREAAGREASPTGGVLDSQTVKAPFAEARGYDGAKRIAMEYSPKNGNPYISRVDGGTLELVRGFGVEVVSSGDLIQQFEATWTDAQWRLHQEAAERTDAAYGVAWQFLAEQIRTQGFTTELDVQARILKHFADTGLVTDHPPIVGEGPHSGDPHYAPSAETNSKIGPGSFVLIDLWAKMDKPNAVYSDLTRVGFVGDEVPADGLVEERVDGQAHGRLRAAAAVLTRRRTAAAPGTGAHDGKT